MINPTPYELARGAQVVNINPALPQFIDWSTRKAVDPDTIFDGCVPIVKAKILPPIPLE